MGLRTHLYGPVATTRRGASQGPGVPRPTTANTHTHHRYNPAPSAITATAGHAAGTAVGSKRVRIHQGSQTAPAPGTTMVNSRLRTTTLSMRASSLVWPFRSGPG